MYLHLAHLTADIAKCLWHLHDHDLVSWVLCGVCLHSCDGWDRRVVRVHGCQCDDTLWNCRRPDGDGSAPNLNLPKAMFRVCAMMSLLHTDVAALTTVNTQHRTSRSCAEHNSHRHTREHSHQSEGRRFSLRTLSMCSPDFPCASCQTLVPKLMLNGICCNAARALCGLQPGRSEFLSWPREVIFSI